MPLIKQFHIQMWKRTTNKKQNIKISIKRKIKHNPMKKQGKESTLVPGRGVTIWRSKILAATLLLLNISARMGRVAGALRPRLGKQWEREWPERNRRPPAGGGGRKANGREIPNGPLLAVRLSSTHLKIKFFSFISRPIFRGFFYCIYTLYFLLNLLQVPVFFFCVGHGYKLC